ncbi:MAG: translation initiation factor 1 [Pseudomonadales bacterium]
MAKQKADGLVYSTDGGRSCPQCRQPIGQCNCKQNNAVASGDGVVRVSRETKGRKGAGVTLIKGAPLAADELKVLAGELKKKCGVGGAIKDGVIEIQGDKRDAVKKVLDAKGWVVKLAGG